jgi:hypothetical protein
MILRILSICLLLFAFFPLHVLAQDECVAAEGEPLVIGAVFPTQSLLTARGSVSYQGAEMMRQTINACGGVNGRPVEWQIVSAQDRYDSAEAAQSLTDAGMPLIVGSGSTAVSEGARDVAEANSVVYWEVSESVEQASEWIFSPRPNNYQQGQQAAQFIEAQFPDARVALVYEDIAIAQSIASGVRDTLTVAPLIDEVYDIYDTYGLASRMRDDELNVLILISFDAEGYYLWYDAREADANLDAWLHIGSEGYWLDLCVRALNIEGFMSLSPFAAASEDYRDAVIGEIDSLYRDLYEQTYEEDPSLEANLSASGVYLLLRYVLPNVEGELTAENVRAAIQGLDIHESIGLMGEGLAFDGGLNVASIAPVRQQQDGRFCSVHPSAIATCVRSVESFPTWRARAIEVDNSRRCGS